MNLYQLLQQLPITDLTDTELTDTDLKDIELTNPALTKTGVPHYLWGSFRRKSITFFNGLTDEHTVVYWFQSKSFSIDLRLLDAQLTPLHLRQGWVGDSLWCAKTQLLSWQISQSYQLHTQWPEPAQLYPIGNCILEFAPSKAYVEDWRQQSTQGLFLGLRLCGMQKHGCNDVLPMHGGLVIVGEHMAYAQSRHPSIQAKLAGYAHLNEVPLVDTHNLLQQAAAPQQTQIDLADINHVDVNHVDINDADITHADMNDYEVSVALNSAQIVYSTQDHRVGQHINLDGFSYSADGKIWQEKTINGHPHTLYYELDMFMPQYAFQHSSPTTAAAQDWVQQQADHLQLHAKIVR